MPDDEIERAFNAAWEKLVAAQGLTPVDEPSVMLVGGQPGVGNLAERRSRFDDDIRAHRR